MPPPQPPHLLVACVRVSLCCAVDCLYDDGIAVEGRKVGNRLEPSPPSRGPALFIKPTIVANLDLSKRQRF